MHVARHRDTMHSGLELDALQADRTGLYTLITRMLIRSKMRIKNTKCFMNSPFQRHASATHLMTRRARLCRCVSIKELYSIYSIFHAVQCIYILYMPVCFCVCVMLRVYICLHLVMELWGGANKDHQLLRWTLGTWCVRTRTLAYSARARF